MAAGSISVGFVVFSWVWIIGTGQLVDPVTARYGWAPETSELAQGLAFVTGLRLRVPLPRTSASTNGSAP